MSKILVIVVSFLLLTATLADAAGVNIGDKPTLKFNAADGRHIDLAQLHGKMVIVDFWATWCGPCMKEAPHMVEINQKYADKGLQMIGISLDVDLNSMKTVAAQKGFTWPMACDGRQWESAYAQSWGVQSIPRTFLISPDGEVLWVGHPALIDDELEKAFKEHPPQLVDPKTLAAANQSLDNAAAALESGKTADAFKAMGGIPEEAAKDPGVAERQKKLATDLQAAGDKVLADAEASISAKDYAKAAGTLRDLSKSLSGTELAKKAQAKLDALLKDPAARAAIDAQKRNDAAAAALAKAQELQAAKKPEMAYTAFKSVAKTYPGTPAATDAAAAIADFEKDPAFVKRASDTAASGPAKSALNLAASYAAAGKTDLAKAKYQSVIDQFPGKTFAEQAKQALGELGN